MTPEEFEAKLKELEETNAALAESINKLEKANSDLVAERKQLKEKLKEGSTDEELKKELENYKAQLEAAESEKAQVAEELTTEIAKLKLSGELDKLGVSFANDYAKSIVVEDLLKEAKFDEGQFKFLNEDGTTRFNEAKKEYGIIDAINTIKESDKGILFAESTGGGAANAEGGSVPPTVKPRATMSIEEKIAYRQEHGEEAYQALPLA